ncbi:MAG: homoserine O-succinyltransferase [Deltaproteobacteria bacterium]|nr:homoserine O-succinyltransferase [Deltaproteobacteria bacterium]
MPRIAILKTGSTRLLDSVARRGGDYESWFAETIIPLGVEVDVIDAVSGTLPATGDWDGLVITGSPASVHDEEPWSEAAAKWVAARVREGVPTLGVCYGHQLLAHALGGATGPAAVPEIGQFEVQITAEDPLFRGLPAVWPSFLIHYNEVTKLPEGARVLAHSPRCDVQAFAIGEHVRAVQWHPEFDAIAVREAIEQDADALARWGEDADTLIAGVEELPEGPKIVENFVREFVLDR